MDFKYSKEDFSYKNYINKRKNQTFFSMITDINGWQAVIFSIIFTIVYFFLKRGVLTDILGVFGITIC